MLLLHAGRLSEALAELRAYLDSKEARLHANPLDLRLARNLQDLLTSMPDVQPACELMSVSKVLNNQEPERLLSAEKKPLTW